MPQTPRRRRLTAEYPLCFQDTTEKPYTYEHIKRAITKGIDSEGKRLEPPMPVWQMSEEDLNDLLEYLKALK